MKRDYKILIDRESKLHNLICKYFNKREEVCFRQSSKDKRDKESQDLINEAHLIIKNTIAEDFGWKHWDIKYERCNMRDMRIHQVTLYVQEHKDDQYICPKCGGQNDYKVVESINLHPCEIETKCTECGWEDYWAYGWYESKVYEVYDKYIEESK